jgi:hypothetical protein
VSLTSVAKKIKENRSNLSGYEANPGGVGVGRGEPLAAMRLKPGGVGVGSGEPLATIGLNPGGVGVGRGQPLVAMRLKPGGVGVGRGDPLSLTADTRARLLLNYLLTELLTGSTIEIAKASNDRRIEIFVFKVETSWQQP